MNLTFAAQLNKMITAGLGGAVEAPETGVAVGRRVEYTSIGPAPILTFEANSELPLKALSVNMEPIQEGSGDPSPENVRPISGRSEVNVWREATYDTSAEPALTIQLGQTVYGGTVDIVSGKMVVDRAYYKVTESTELATDAVYTDFTRMNFIVDGVRLSGKPSGAIISNIFKPGALVVNGVFMHGTTGTINITPEISAGTTLAQIRDWLVANNAEICYELAQPITITLTAEQLTTVLGVNNVWSDADEVSLTYGNIYYTEGY